MSGYRKKWELSSSGAVPNVVSKPSAPVQTPHTKAYDQYLSMLQERNRLLKKLKVKDAHQIELEKREQGFALYLNGANFSRTTRHMQAPPTRKSRSITSDVANQPERKRPSKTADCNHNDGSEALEVGESRAKTAPLKRKSWAFDSIELRTEDGDPLHVKAPGMLSGKYDDDFESTLTDATVDQFDGQTTSSDTANAATCRPVPEERESDSAESTDAESEETEGGDDTLTVSFDDIGVLRRSLERDEMIRESLASNPKWDGHEQDSLNSCSSEGSFSEEIDDSDEESNPPGTQPHPVSSATTDKLAKGDGIVLQFPATQSDSLKMRKGVVDDNDKSLIELHSTSTVEMYPASSVSLDQGAEMTHVDWSEPQSLHRQATRSLSSVRRKQPPRCGDGLVGGDIPAMDEVLHAVKAENESLPSSHTQSQSELVAGGDGKSCLRKSSSLELNTIGNQITPAPTVDNPPLRIKGSLLPSLPFKPVLVNRYKSTVSTKPSVRGESAPAKSTTLTKPLATAAEVGVTVEASTMEIRKEKHEVSVKEQPSNEFRDRGAPEESLISRLSEDFKGAGEVAIQPLTSTSHASGELKSQRVSSISSTSCQVRGREMAGSPLTGQASGLISSREVISDSVTSPRSGGVRGDEVASRRSGGVRGDEVASPRSGGVRGDGVASHSITEHTVKVITDKVRQMDARKQRRLLRILARLDRQISPPPSSTPAQGSTEAPPPSPAQTWDDKTTTNTNTKSPSWLRSESTNTQTTSPNMVFGDRHDNAPPHGPTRTSTRSSGITRPLLSRQFDSNPDLSTSDLSSRPSSSRPVSGRMSGLRGELYSQQKSRPPSHTPLASFSDPHLPTFLDSDATPPASLDETIGSSHGEPQRLQTAVLAKGRRTIRLSSSGSNTCLVPCIGDDVITTPTLSHAEPDLSSTQFDPRHSHSHHMERQSVNECLESISKFDHLHLGQIGSNIQDDVLESFLSEYREKRLHRQQKGASRLTHSTDSRSCPTPTADSASQEWYDPHIQDGKFDTEDSTDNGDDDVCFTTPEDPKGVELVINLLTTWGDKFYIGLTGVELYANSGEPAQVTQISADPADINVLPEYSGDPRVVTNLLDGVNQTRDDLHMWLAPFTSGHTHTIRILLSRATTLAMVRIWNYNKSRIHSSRGARLAEMYFDGQLIFKGELARATGGVGGAEGSETILFTTDAEVLSLVADHDPLYQSEAGLLGCASGDDEENTGHSEIQRPPTADRDDQDGRGDMPYSEQRPFTSARLVPNPQLQPGHSVAHEETSPPTTMTEKGGLLYSSDEVASSTSGVCPSAGSIVQICLVESWGDPDYTGLTGFQLLKAPSGEPVELREDQLTGVGEGFETLVGGVNLTTEEENMCLFPLDPLSAPPTITVTLATPTPLFGMRIWNYNASLEESYKGVKVAHVYVDGVCISPESGYLIRRAPGHTHYNFGQTIAFQEVADVSARMDLTQINESLPRGFVYQLQLLSSWGDPYYVGLNGLEIYDHFGERIHLSQSNIAAFPDSVNVLPGVKGDVRTVDKLIDGVYDSGDGRHMWLAPILPNLTNNVFVVFDHPVTVSEVRLWNYAKTPSRGLKDFALFVDDLLVCSGCLPPLATHAQGILPTIRPPMKPYIITLSDPALHDNGGRCGHLEEVEFGGDIQFTNNQQVVIAPTKTTRRPANQDLRPLTSLTLHSHRLKSKMW